jgi:hypothetical protein
MRALPPSTLAIRASECFRAAGPGRRFPARPCPYLRNDAQPMAIDVIQHIEFHKRDVRVIQMDGIRNTSAAARLRQASRFRCPSVRYERIAGSWCSAITS